MSSQPTRILWYTDTLGDVNGVSRFIRNMADQALHQQRDITIVTSTGFAVPDQPNIINFKPRFAAKMPRYEQLEIVLPPFAHMLQHARRHQPHLIHVSTPGPVGLVGLRAARRLRIPLIGTYHTDFPSYIDHLFDDNACTRLGAAFMRWFYGRCRIVLSRSPGFIEPIRRLGIPDDRIHILRSGINLDDFGERYRDPHLWPRLGINDETSIKVLYVGRVSIEKNLPLLTRAWPLVHRAATRANIDADLVVVGDGPYLHEMRRALDGARAHFLGFRHGRELASIYASSDIFVFPSRTDTLGQSVMEAQASALPAIVSDQGGPKTIVAHNTTGLVVSGERDTLWADAITSLIAHPERRRDLAARAAKAMQHRGIDDSFTHFCGICEHARAPTTAHEPALPADQHPGRAG